MHIDIPDDLNRRLKQLAKGTGQAVDVLVCEAIEQRLAREEQRAKHPDITHANGGLEETGKPIWELFEDASLEIPDEELDRLPRDGSLQHDHYIYGTPKRPACVPSSPIRHTGLPYCIAETSGIGKRLP